MLFYFVFVLLRLLQTNKSEMEEYYLRILELFNDIVNFEHGCLIERQSVEKRVEKENALCRKAFGRKKGRKAISIVCLKMSHMVKRRTNHYLSFRQYDLF